ncbi:transposase [Phocaeicola vulgatus]|nr:transposase [Phocaeicola vulgatus]
MMKEAWEKRTTNILDISGKKYAFDSTTITLCVATFPWAKSRSKKGGVKAHILYDIEAKVPVFYTITTPSKHDSTAMSSIQYRPNAYYRFDRAYDSFKEIIGYILQTLSLLSEPRRT